MGITKLEFAFLGAIAVAGALAGWVQARNNAELRDELARLRLQDREIARWRMANEQLGKTAAEVQEYRADDAALARLSGEATNMKERFAAESRAAALARVQAERAKLTNLLLRHPRGDAVVVAQRAKLTALQKSLGLPLEQPVLAEVRELDQPLKATAQSRPQYPAALRSTGLPGEVVVAFVLGDSGVVVDAFAQKSTNPAFEAAAVDAIRQWKFTPAQRAGLPVNVQVQMPIVFSLNDGKAPGWF